MMTTLLILTFLPLLQVQLVRLGKRLDPGTLVGVAAGAGLKLGLGTRCLAAGVVWIVAE